MFKSLAVLALGVAIGGCATQQTASADAVQSPDGQAQAQTHRECKTIEDDATGTKIGTRQECYEVANDKSTEPKAN